VHKGEASELFPKQEGEDLLDNRTKIAVLSLKTVLILRQEPLEIMKEHPVEDRVFRMTLAIDPYHGREDDSRNGPEKASISPETFMKTMQEWGI